MALGAALIAIVAVVDVTMIDPRVTVRWHAEVGPADRVALERRYGLGNAEPIGGTSWRYQLGDQSRDNIRALIQDPSVDDTGYIDALAESIRDHWAQQGKAEKTLFSFHGLPKHYFLAGDPYFCECHKTARLTAAQLELDDNTWTVSFQSRFGPKEWLKPYTDKLLKKWRKSGVESVDVICPGFSADCLETLEEINIRYRDIFIKAGGKRFSYIPALNDQAVHITALVNLIEKHCEGWPEISPEWNQTDQQEQLNATKQRADKIKNT